MIDWWTAKAVELERQYGIEAFYCDPAEPAYIAQFQQAGVSAVEAVNDIRPGIDAVKQRLAVAGDGRPRLRFLRSANSDTDPDLELAKKPLGVRDEITAYVYPKAADGKPVKEIPVDDNNHGMDAMRYAVMGIDNSTWLLG